MDYGSSKSFSSVSSSMSSVSYSASSGSGSSNNPSEAMCFTEFFCTYNCDSQSFGAVTQGGSNCGNNFGIPLGVWMKVGGTTTICIYGYVATGVPCLNVANCQDFPPAPPSAPTDSSDCHCPTHSSGGSSSGTSSSSSGGFSSGGPPPMGMRGRANPILSRNAVPRNDEGSRGETQQKKGCNCGR